MIQSLLIQNYVLIDSLEIDFQSGLSVVTGETGAGKSIILGALGLILGQRAESKIFRDNEKKCIIEGTFCIDHLSLESFFEENELEFDPQHCIIRREMQPSGKSRAFVNDTPTQLNVLKHLGDKLIDIHSQHQNLLLSDPLYQLKVLDLLSSNNQTILHYRTTFEQYRKANSELQKLKSNEKKGKQDEEYYRFQHNQLAEANLKTGELEELETELEELTHAEEIKTGFFRVDALISEDETGVISRLRAALTELHTVANVYPKAQELHERLESDYIDLKDLASECSSLAERVEHDPLRLEWVNERLNTLYSLQQKHHVKSVDQLIEIEHQLAQKLSLLDNYEQMIEEKEREVAHLRNQTLQLGSSLTEERKQQARMLEQSIVERVKYLAIPNIRFEVAFQPKSEPDETGLDDVNYLFSANKNAPLLPVIETASGGEVSRMMLCIKALIAAKSSVSSIIFDEIDTGVSGDVADRMGEIMREMSSCMQVICITHLPQIAVKGESHFKVYKTDTETTTQTHLDRLTPDERVVEIARMLSGSSLTDAALENARQLMNTTT